MNLIALTDSQLLDATRAQLRRANEADADLLLLLGEIEDRKLFADRAYSSMFAFCVEELGFSEDAACNRLGVAHLARRFPRVLDFLRAGRIHLTGLRLLAPLLTATNLEDVLTSASGKSKRAIEQLIASLAPKPPVPARIRKLPASRGNLAGPAAALTASVATTATAVAPAMPVPATLAGVAALGAATAVTAPPASLATPEQALMLVTPELERPSRPAVVKPLSAETYKVEFTADRALKDKLALAADLMSHRVRKGDLAAILDRALDVLIEQVKKERFGVGRKPRGTAAQAEQRQTVTRHVPTAIVREVYERDGGSCTFVSDDGRRCGEKHGVEIEHLDGFARTGEHRVDRLTLRCRTHNQHAADKMYGREFMDTKRRSIRPGADSSPLLL